MGFLAPWSSSAYLLGGKEADDACLTKCCPGLIFYNAAGPSGEELRAANGAIVGLMSAQPSGGGAVRCVGMGLVRGVDVNATGGPKLHILTPTPPEVLPSVTELVAGSLEIPPQLLHSSRYVSPYISLFCLASEGTAAGKMKSRNTLTRRAHT